MHALTAWEAALLAGAGVAAGFVNTAAGAGSLLSLRALMLLGLPADVANGTNRLPVLAQSLAAAHAFDRGGALNRRAVVRVAAPACVGALAGSVAASFTPERVMRWLLIVVLLGVAVVGVLSALRKRSAAPSEDAAAAEPVRLSWGTGLWLFVAGSYGGFLQAGVGLVLIFALHEVGKMSLVRANALKVVTVALFSVVSVAVFVARGQVAYPHAIAMSVGSVAGARLGVAYAMRYARQLQIFVVAVDIAACAALLWREWA
jgi:hypothetical protein